MLEMNRLYPQYNFVNDRRKQNMPVSEDRRSGVDRRSGTRIVLDTNLTRDIYDVKNKIAQSQSQSQVQNNRFENKAQKITFTQNSSKVVQNNLPKDAFLKTTKPTASVEASKMEVDKMHASDGMLAGALGSILVGALASTFMGVAGVGVALGLGAVVGAKGLKSVIVSHIVESKGKIKK